MPDVPALSRTSLTDQVIRAVRADIQRGALRPGELYSVQQLAERFSVSRTPVREGLLRLADAGVLEFERNRGFRILDSDHRRIAEVFQTRILLEVPAAHLAAGLIDTVGIATLDDHLAAMDDAAERGATDEFWEQDVAFHGAVIDASGNRQLGRIVAGLRDLVLTIGATTLHGRSLHEVGRAHIPIRDALRSGDPDRAAVAMREHLVSTASLLLAPHPEMLEMVASAGHRWTVSGVNHS